MKIGFHYETDTPGVFMAVKIVFNPGANYFTVYYHENFDLEADNLRQMSGPYWTALAGQLNLVDFWNARFPTGSNFQVQLVEAAGLPLYSGVFNFWDDTVTDWPYPDGWTPNLDAYQAFSTFLAQPRIVDPCKGWSAEELQGPYTNAADLADLVKATADSSLGNLTVRPRAIMRQDAVEGTFLMNSEDRPDSSVTIAAAIPIGTILPIRPIGFVGTPTAGEWVALW